MSSGEKVDAKEEEEEIYISHPQPNASLSPSPTQSPHNTDDTNNGVDVDVAPIKVDAPPPPIPPITHAPSPPSSPLSTTAVDQSQDRDPPPPPTLLKDPNALHPYPHSQHLNLISQDEDSGVKSLPLKFAPSKHLSPKTMTLPLTQEPQGDENIQELKHPIKKEQPNLKSDELTLNTPTKSFLFESAPADGYESGTEEEQAAFLKDVENFYRDNNLEFKAPKFYKEELNLLKLWRAVIKLGGYEQVTSCKLWRQVGESFRPPKTCTTVSWTFRMFYEKALLEYEKNKMRTGQLPFPDPPPAESISVESQAGGSQALGSGRARRDAAARAMQGWHSQRLLGNGQVFHPIIKDKNLSAILKNDKQLKTNGLLKRKRPAAVEHAYHVAHMKTVKPQGDGIVIDVGPPADWVKINVQRTNDCFEIYALVPGLLREEVHVQSDPAGRLIISGQPEQLDNPWGVTPFKKVISLPSRIDPQQTSAVVTLHGQLFVRVPFEQSDHH